MKKTTKQKNVLQHIWDRLTQIAVAMDYDSTQYTYDQVASLQAELVAIKARVKELEADPNRTGIQYEEAAA